MLRVYVASEANEEAASRNRAEAKTNVVYFNDGGAVKREKLGISAAKTRRLGPKPVDARLNGWSSGKRNYRIHETHAPTQHWFRTELLIIVTIKTINGRQLRLVGSRLCEEKRFDPEIAVRSALSNDGAPASLKELFDRGYDHLH